MLFEKDTGDGKQTSLEEDRMESISHLIKKLEDQHADLFWQGEASLESINKLQTILKCVLPRSFKDFLLTYGGGGISEEEISGIEANDPYIQNRGTVLGDTLLCREEFQLPEHFIVIYFGMDNVVWCLDTSKLENEECPVISYDVYLKKSFFLFPTFNEFMHDFLTHRINR